MNASKYTKALKGITLMNQTRVASEGYFAARVEAGEFFVEVHWYSTEPGATVEWGCEGFEDESFFGSRRAAIAFALRTVESARL